MGADKFDIAEMRNVAAKVSTILKVMANADRLMLLCQLSHGEHCVSELETALEIYQPTLSQQLAVLRDEGLVNTRREGKQIYYAVASQDVLAILNTLYEQFCAPLKRETTDD